MTSETSEPTGQRTRAEETRARLLDAAVEAFSAKGFHGTTTRDIAAAAGMSPAALYVHHKTKEELLYLIASAGHRDTLQLIVSARASSDEPREQLKTFVRTFAAHHARNHATARIVNYELAALTAPHFSEVMEQRRAIMAETCEVIRDGLSRGSFNAPDPTIAATAVLSLGIDIARWYREGRTWTPDDIGASYAELALRMVGAGTQDAAIPRVGAT